MDFTPTALEQRNYDYWDARPDLQDIALKQLMDPVPEESLQQVEKFGGVKLDYVGHAWLTEILLKVDPRYVWRPMHDPIWRPTFPTNEKTPEALGMWGWVTICGVTRPAFGSVEERQHEKEKELIGDLLRNGAMRAGVALDLWRGKAGPTKASSHQKPSGPVRQFKCACGHEDRSAAFHTIVAEFKAKDGSFKAGDKISKCPKCAMWASPDSYTERHMEKGVQS